MLPVVVVLAGTNRTWAQYPGATPQVSPYINLLGPGNTAVNYYGIVRPQLQMQAGLLSLQGALINEERYLGTPEMLANLPVITGNFATFQNQGRFFGTRGITTVTPGVVSGLAGFAYAGATGGGLPGSLYGAGGGVPGMMGASGAYGATGAAAGFQRMGGAGPGMGTGQMGAPGGGYSPAQQGGARFRPY
jgi:hypothetical protein